MRVLSRGRLIAASVLLFGLATALVATRDNDTPMRSIQLPDGFQIGLFAADVPDARSMALGDANTLFVGTRNQGEVYAIPLIADAVGTLRAGERRTLASGLNRPNGVAYRDGALYVAEVSRILRFDDIESRLDDPQFKVIRDDYPSVRHHGWKYIAFGPDGKLYIPIGAPCNVCTEDGFAVITRMNPDGSEREVFAEGVRNTVGFTWHPDSGEMWFTDNGRDWMGDDVPPCELNQAPQAGMHFGFPYCHGADIPDPDFATGRQCGEFTSPAWELGPHVAPLGLKFYTGAMFPEGYRNQLFIAEHGSWNRSDPIGYRITLVRLVDGQAVSAETFAEGWLQDGDAWGRPVDLLLLPDGSMLVSDDKGGRIFRITYTGDQA